MRSGRTGGLAGIVAAAAALAGGLLVLRSRFRRRISREIDLLLAARQPSVRQIVGEADLAGLPAPVQRWLRRSGIVGKAIPASVRLKMEGTFRLGPDKRWMPFEAQEYFTTNPPGFVWVASMCVAPMISIFGRDRYIDGTGDIDMRALSLVPVARKRGGGLNQGALLRYLNESMWFPAAALSPWITWKAIDANSAQATVSYAGESASATFFFNDAGDPTNMTADRYNDAAGRLLPWSTPLVEHDEFAGVPGSGCR